MSTTALTKPSTPLSTVSSLGTINTAHTTATVQSGPYTKAQFQSTMEGSRSVKNAKEIEQLLRDYPAALDLYRTGRYKVKVKNEADVERVILVEKRTTKNSLTDLTKTNGFQQNEHPIPHTSTNLNQTKEDTKKSRDSEQTRSRTHSRDHVGLTTSVIDNNNSVQPTTSSMYMLNNTQPKVDRHRVASKERDSSVVSQPKQHIHRHTRSHESPSIVSQLKHKGKKSNRDYPKAVVPYVPHNRPNGNMWHQSRAVQPYYSNPVLPQQANIYMPSPYITQQNPVYQQQYYYGQQALPALTYHKPSAHPTKSTGKSGGNVMKSNLYSAHNYPSTWTMYSSNNGAPLQPSFHTFHSNPPQYPPSHAMYQSQMPGCCPMPTNKLAGPVMYNNTISHAESRRSSKNRTRSVDAGPRSYPPVRHFKQQQQAAPEVIEQHHHRHHHHRSHPTTVQTNNIVSTVESTKEQNIPFKEPSTAANHLNNTEKLTIRQLNEIFAQADTSARLPYSSLPTILQRFGIALSENDLISAARDLDYNTNEPISARRLVHVLVKLGKIARSTHTQKQQQRPVSPSILPEDREVTDIMTQRRPTGAQSTHIHSSAQPNHWY